LAFVLGFGLPLIALSPVQAQTDVTGPVAFTVHKASCPIDYAATSTGGIYEACHENKVEGVTFTISGAEFDPLAFFTDAEGVGVAMILDEITSATEVTLTEDPLSLSTLGGWVYCKDQVGGAILFDGPTPGDGIVALGSVNTSQVIICDWYNYTPADGEVDPSGEVEANG
jgi:hypothetical protein